LLRRRRVSPGILPAALDSGGGDRRVVCRLDLGGHATITDRRLGLAEKAIWVAELLIFPIVGLLVWLVSRAFRRRQGA
jgi:hypothetical protein